MGCVCRAAAGGDALKSRYKQWLRCPAGDKERFGAFLQWRRQWGDAPVGRGGVVVLTHSSRQQYLHDSTGRNPRSVRHRALRRLSALRGAAAGRAACRAWGCLQPAGSSAALHGDVCILRWRSQLAGMFAAHRDARNVQECLQHMGMLVVHRNVCIVRGCVWHAGMFAVLLRSHRCLQQFFSLAPSLCLSFPLLRASTALELWDSAHCCLHPNDGFV